MAHTKQTTIKEVDTGAPRMPSADLITFRFDQTDKNIQDLNDKLDNIVSGFVTEKELLEVRTQATEEHKAIWQAINSMKSNAKWAIGTIILAISALASVFYGIHK